MKNEKIISRTNITEIFIAAVLMVSLILVREFEVAGMRMSYFLLLLLALLYAGYQIRERHENGGRPGGLECRADVIVLALLLWNLLSIMGKMFQDPDTGAIHYDFQAVWIVLGILYFEFKRIKIRDWYFDLILYAGLIMTGFILFCYLCDWETAGWLSGLLHDSGRTASYLLLPCIVSVCRYCFCRDKIRSLFYLLVAAVSFFTLFINYNMVSLWIMVFVFLAIPVLMRPTAELVKRDMQLFFLYGFMLSNMSLLANYTELIQKETMFSLEYSVYLELLLAVGGVFFFRYWDRIPEDADRERLVLRRMRRGYQFLLKLLGLLFAGFVLGGERWRELPEGAGAPMGEVMVRSFAVPLLDELKKGKSGWLYCLENSRVTTLLLLVLTVLLTAKLRKNQSFAKPRTAGLFLPAAVFLVQVFFYVPDINVLPVYLLFLIWAAFYREEKKRFVVTKINLNKESMEK